MDLYKLKATPLHNCPLLVFIAEVRCETVDVKYHGLVDLKTFECHDINRSSFIQRACYDKAQSISETGQSWSNSSPLMSVERLIIVSGGLFLQ
jgi:hypothetical protein